MIYRSNLVAPDLAPYFKTHYFDYIGGHTFIGDPDFDPRCGFFTHDEAAILYNVASAITRMSGGHATWLDIGARTGWTAAHIIAAGGCVVALEPEYHRPDFRARALENVGPVREKYQYGRPCFLPWALRSDQFFEQRVGNPARYDGFVIDANHDEPEPLRDAERSLAMAKAAAVFVIHDFQGPATFRAAEYLLDHGCECKIYWTPNMIAVCWRGFDAWEPPAHRPDPELLRVHRATIGRHFNLARCKA